MKLYETAATPNCRRVTIFLKEMGINLEHIEVDVRRGENLTPEFYHKSINGKVPALEITPNTYLCESMAICRYFDEQTPKAQSLFGSDALSRAQVEMWNRIIEWNGLLPAFQAFRNRSGVYQDRETCIPEWGEESQKRLESFLPTLANQLGQNTYITGDVFSVADIGAWLLIEFSERRLLLPIQQTYPAIARWYQQLAARPAFAQ